MKTPKPPTDKLALALKVSTALAPIVLALLAGYVYDIRPFVHDVCEALLPFGTVTPTIPLPEADAGAAG